MSYTAFIFDLDGTILNTCADLGNACNWLLRKYGWPEHELESYKMRVGRGFKRLVEQAVPAEILQQKSEEEITALTEEGLLYYRAHLADRTQSYPEMVDTLQKLGQAGCKLAVLSNKPDIPTQMLMKHFYPEVFQVVHGSVPHLPRKPDPTSARLTLQELGVTKEQAVYVGDTAIDMETAHRAEIFSIGVAWGFRGVKELTDAAADTIIDRPSDLLKFL